MAADQVRTHYCTGNEFLALDEISASDGSIHTLAFLYEAARGAMLVGSQTEDFLKPSVSIDDQRIDFSAAVWNLKSHWIPTFELTTSSGVVSCTYLAPPERRGIALRIEFTASKACNADIGFELGWASTLHVCNTVRHMQGVRSAGVLAAKPKYFYIGFRSAWPIFSFGFVPDEGSQWTTRAGQVTISPSQPEITALSHELVRGHFHKRRQLQAGEKLTMTLNLGVGIEASSSLACAEDMLEQGWDNLLQITQSWLTDRTIVCYGDAEPYESRLNQNALYNYFFSQGVAIDSERMVVTSSRSPRFENTGSYRDRDACLFSLPAVLLIDPNQARRMLSYTFNVQMRNIGARSRYMDGVLLEPGFGLDNLVAPLRALWMYVEMTGDHTILFDLTVQSGVNRILETLETLCHPEFTLYRTHLAPNGQPAPLPYLTYDNVLVWRALVDVSDLYHRIRDVERASETAQWAKDIRAAIIEKLIVNGPPGPMFCYASDLESHYELGNVPEGSLKLLAHLDFCLPEFPPFQNTAEWVREYNASKEWDQSCVLVLGNELLAGQKDRITEVLARPMDNGIACWWVDSKSGEGRSGLGWAACAGYLAYAIAHTLERELDLPVLREDLQRKSRISRSTLRPGVGWV